MAKSVCSEYRPLNTIHHGWNCYMFPLCLYACLCKALFYLGLFILLTQIILLICHFFSITFPNIRINTDENINQSISIYFASICRPPSNPAIALDCYNSTGSLSSTTSCMDIETLVDAAYRYQNNNNNNHWYQNNNNNKLFSILTDLPYFTVIRNPIAMQLLIQRQIENNFSRPA